MQLSVYKNYKRLRIALVIKNFVSTGGAEKYSVEVAQRLLAKGHTIDLFARNIDQELARGMNVIRVPDKLKFSSVLSLYSFSKEIEKRLRGRRDYDVIHTHDKGCTGHLSTVHTFSFKRGMTEVSFLKRLNEYTFSPRARLYFYMERKQIKSHKIVAVSELVKKDIQLCHHRNNDIFVIVPGVDVNEFSPETVACYRSEAREKEGLKPDDIVILFVGSEFKRKGLDHLIPALDSKMKLFVVGRQEKMRHYRKMVTGCDMSRRVKFVGLIDKIKYYYALADIVVLPSVFEAFGMSILEGMACGLPVVTSQASGCSLLIKNEKNGFVFNEPDELPKILSDLKQAEIRNKLGKNGRKTAMQNTWNDTAQKYEALYYEIAGLNG